MVRAWFDVAAITEGARCVRCRGKQRVVRMTTPEIKPAKVCYVFAALALLAGLGLLIAGCHPLSPPLTERETQCAGCMSGSCSLELAACDSDNSCECVRRCHATPQPLMHADLWCPKVCHGRSRIYNAQVACMDAHCADVCSQ